MTPSPEERARAREIVLRISARINAKPGINCWVDEAHPDKVVISDIIQEALKAYGDERVEDAAVMAEFFYKDPRTGGSYFNAQERIATAIRNLKSQPSDKSNE